MYQKHFPKPWLGNDKKVKKQYYLTSDKEGLYGSRHALSIAAPYYPYARNFLCMELGHGSHQGAGFQRLNLPNKCQMDDCFRRVDRVGDYCRICSKKASVKALKRKEQSERQRAETAIMNQKTNGLHNKILEQLDRDGKQLNMTTYNAALRESGVVNKEKEWRIFGVFQKNILLPYMIKQFVGKDRGKVQQLLIGRISGLNIHAKKQRCGWKNLELTYGNLRDTKTRCRILAAQFKTLVGKACPWYKT